MSIKSTGDSSLPPLKTTVSSPQDGEALTYSAATGTWINGIPFTTVKPAVTTPSSGTILTAAVTTNFATSTTFSVAPNNYLLTHYASDWQVASDTAFSNILVSTTLDTTNKTTWAAVVPSGSGTVYVRLRFHNGQEYSAWSDTVSFQVYQVYTYTTTQNITVPNTTNIMEVNLVGGGSGSSSATEAIKVKGGSAGGVTQNANLAVTPGSTVLVTVGAGASGANLAGTSSFGNLASASGGNTNTSGNGFAKGNNNTNDTVNAKGGGGGGAGSAGNTAQNRAGYGTSSGGNGGNGVTFNIDGIARGGGGAGGSTSSGNSLYGFSAGNAVAGGGTGNNGGGQGGNYSGTGGNGSNGFGGGAGGSAIGSNATTTGGNGLVQIKYIS
jgi:hypothetical protein